MANKLSTNHLLQISKGDAKTLNNFRLGVHLFTTSGRSVDDLTEAACKDRLAFAHTTLKCARWAATSPKPQYRVTLARAYYAMYHAARAMAYFVERGDDHEAHQELPRHLPQDFPDRAVWENNLKNARFERNRADYDPYPKSDRPFANVAKATLNTAEIFLPLVRRYLIRKGCAL